MSYPEIKINGKVVNEEQRQMLRMQLAVGFQQCTTLVSQTSADLHTSEMWKDHRKAAAEILFAIDGDPYLYDRLALDDESTQRAAIVVYIGNTLLHKTHAKILRQAIEDGLTQCENDVSKLKPSAMMRPYFERLRDIWLALRDMYCENAS